MSPCSATCIFKHSYFIGNYVFISPCSLMYLYFVLRMPFGSCLLLLLLLTSTVTLAHARRGLTSTVTLAHARRGLISTVTLAHARRGLIILIEIICDRTAKTCQISPCSEIYFLINFGRRIGLKQDTLVLQT